jgi:hypothetical protein
MRNDNFMDPSRSKNVTIYYILAFLLALFLRFVQLGALPLGDSEASWALQALGVARGARPLLGPQPAYIVLTGLSFFLFGPTNFLARFLPALAGSLLVLVVYLFRDRFKPVPGLLLAFFLALDPGLVALSRQAGSLMPALTFTLLAWALWYQRRPRLAGVTAGLALLAGPGFWAGALALGLAWAVHRAMEREPGGDRQASKVAGARQRLVNIRFEEIRPALLFAGGTILLGGTLFFLSPAGLSAWVASLPDYLGGWFRPSGVPASRLLLALVVYQPLAVLLGVASLVRGWWEKSPLRMQLSLWLLVALALSLLYPARQVGDLAWVVLPLWALAALELANHIRIDSNERREVSGVALLVVLLLIFSWLDYAGIALDPLNPANLAPNGIQVGGTILFRNLPPTRYLLLISVLLLLVVSVVMIALGWSLRTARLGSVWGLAVALGIYLLGVSWGATGLRTPDGWELWWSDARPVQARLLLTTVADLSDWSMGEPNAQPVTLLSVESPALQWLLRDRAVQTLTALDPGQAPPIVISPQTEELGLEIPYRGQDFIWRGAPSWGILTGYDWMRWSVFRKLPNDSEIVIVWVRSDLFPDMRESLP